MKSILIRNAKILVGDEFTEAYVLVEDGIVKAISKTKPGEADQEIDAYHQPLIPGGIDMHAHVYDPEYRDNEDWRTGSLAALYGGITTIYDMPLRLFVDTKSAVQEKIREASRNSYVNYGIIAGFFNENNYKRIIELAEEGIRGYKVFTTRPFKPDELYYPVILETIANVNGVAVIHAEDDALVAYGEAKYRVQNDPLAWHLHRTGYAEASAILRIGYIALDVGAHVHIAHLSSKEGVEAIALLKRKKARITSEVCPHHLYFTRRDVDRYGSYLKVAPTIKSSEDREELWNALSEGLIEAYASDNAPAPRELKEADVWSAWSGIPSLEVMIPFLYTYGVLQRRISFQRFIDVTSRNPARIMGIYPSKGELCVGCDADLVVIDTRKPVKYSSTKHHHKVDWSPWDGLYFYGTPIHVVINGELMLKDRELVGEPGKAKYVRKRAKSRELAR